MSTSDHSHDNSRRKQQHNVAPMSDLTPRMGQSATMMAESRSNPVATTGRFDQLPDEILLQIAKHLYRNASLSSFYLVNKHFNTVASEALAKTLVVRDETFPVLVRWLANNPGLIHLVSAIEFVESPCVTVIEYTEDRALFGGYEAFRNIIIARCQDPIYMSMLLGFQRAWWGFLAPWYSLDVLTLTCSNIKAVTIQHQVLQPFDAILEELNPNFSISHLPMVNPFFIPVPPFQNEGLYYLKSKLESLTISQHRGWAGPIQREILTSPIHVRGCRIGRPPITLYGFNQLRHLDLPMDVLGSPVNIRFQVPYMFARRGWMPFNFRARHGLYAATYHLPLKFIPLSIEHLKLRHCTSITFVLLKIFTRIPKDKSRLKRIDLYFTTCARAFINLCLQAGFGPIGYINTLSKIVGLGIKVSFYAGQDEQPVDMYQELMSIINTSHIERGILALCNQQYSAINILAARRRKSLGLEHRLFMQFAASHFELLNRPTFVVEKWSRVAFFTGEKHVYPRTRLTKMPRRNRPQKLDDFEFDFSASIPLTPNLAPSDSSTKIFTSPVAEGTIIDKSVIELDLPEQVSEQSDSTTNSEQGFEQSDTGKNSELSSSCARNWSCDRASKIPKRETSLMSKRKTLKRPLRPPTAQQDRVQQRQVYYERLLFEHAMDQTKPVSSEFLSEMWRGVTWKEYLQPHVVRTFTRR